MDVNFHCQPDCFPIQVRFVEQDTTTAQTRVGIAWKSEYLVRFKRDPSETRARQETDQRNVQARRGEDWKYSSE
jgi:hypothetical protein